MSTSIDDAIAKARDAAANAVPSTQSSGAVVEGNTTRAAPLGLDDMMSGAISVDAWIKVTEHGLQVGTDRTLFETIPVTIDLSAVAYCFSVRWGNPVQYDKTYDRRTSAKGKAWSVVVAEAQKVDDKASEFRSADLPFVLRESLTNKKGETVIEAGSTLGHSLSVTGWKNYQEFVKSLEKAGLDPRREVVDLDLEFEVRTDAKGTWGILKFENARVSDEDPE